jgi:hypothetical protein
MTPFGRLVCGWPGFPGRDEAILCGMNRLTWLSEWSADTVRDALGRAAPGLGEGSIALDPPVADTSDPQWAGGTATGGQFIAKFAFSEPTAGRLWREALVLQALGGQPGLCLPEVLAASSDPVFFATRPVDGVPLSYEMISAASQAQADQLGSELAGFLSSLHRACRTRPDPRPARGRADPAPYAFLSGHRRRVPGRYLIDAAAARRVGEVATALGFVRPGAVRRR